MLNLANLSHKLPHIVKLMVCDGGDKNTWNNKDNQMCWEQYCISEATVYWKSNYSILLLLRWFFKNIWAALILMTIHILTWIAIFNSCQVIQPIWIWWVFLFFYAEFYSEGVGCAYVFAAYLVCVCVMCIMCIMFMCVIFHIVIFLFIYKITFNILFFGKVQVDLKNGLLFWQSRA